MKKMIIEFFLYIGSDIMKTNLKARWSLCLIKIIRPQELFYYNRFNSSVMF